MLDVVIIGSGPAGLCAAIYARRAGLSAVTIEKSPMSGGQILNTYEVDNYPGLPGSNGFDMGMKFREHADKLGCEFMTASVLEIRDGKLCGFAISLKDANKLKKYSSIFSKVSSVIMDELQPETGAYLHDEVDLFTSIVQSVSRGGGKQSRYVTWCLLGNNISVMNPYFLNLGVYKYIDDTLDLKEGEDFYIKGEGWVCEFSYNKSAKEEMEKNPAIRAFTSRNSILGLTADFMIKSSGFIEKKVKGKMDYLFTLKYKGEFMGVRRVKASGIIYVTSSYDPSFKHTVAISDSDHDDATIKLRKNTFYIQTLRDAYTIAKLRFSDFKTKNAIVELLGIDYYRE